MVSDSSSTTATTNGQTNKVLAGVVYGLMAAVAWGLSPVVTRLGVVGTLDPYDVAALRFLVAGAVLLPLVWRKRRESLSWTLTLVMAAGAGLPFMLMLAGGVTYASAGHGGVIIPSTMLVCSMLGGWLVLGDKPDAKRLTGYGVILIGVVLIGREGFLGSFAPNAWIGDLMFVGSGILWASYTVAARRAGAEPLHATALVAVISMVLYLPVYFLWRGDAILAHPVSDVLIQAGFQGLINAIFALFCYTRAVKYLGATRGSVFAALVPVFAVLFAYPILGEVPNGMEMIGMVIVSVGMVTAIGLMRRKKA